MSIQTTNLTPAQQRAKYNLAGQSHGKPHYTTPAKQILSFSEEFKKKELCTGPTINLGLACDYQCSYCYVPGLMGRHPTVLAIGKTSGNKHQEISLTKSDPLPTLKRELLYADATPRFMAHEVVFTSTLIDPCSNKEMLANTLGACKLVLAHTPWTIRLLTKSAAVVQLAKELVGDKDRVIFGVSTGTLDDNVARHVERGASSPTARINSLRTLAESGFQTFGMICPILPKTDLEAFADEVASKILPYVTEHVWAEVLNARGSSFRNTIEALKQAGDWGGQIALQKVHSNKATWEEYARDTFAALGARVQAGKFHFLQYVQEGQTTWWRNQMHRGAVLLGKYA